MTIALAGLCLVATVVAAGRLAGASRRVRGVLDDARPTGELLVVHRGLRADARRLGEALDDRAAR